MSRKWLLLFIVAGVLPGLAKDRRDTPEPAKSTWANPLSQNRIDLDGLLDEDAWVDAHFATGFVQRNPLQGESATERTEFAVLYDDEYLYIGIKAHDSQPHEIRSILSRRDEETPSDWLFVSLDSYSDYRTAFEFGLNPHGVKRDLRRFDDENRDDTWDALWEGHTTVHPQGWSAEFKIPFRELRFSNGDSQSWGIQVYRHISRKNEDDYWTSWSKEESGWVRHYGRLEGLREIPKQRRLYVTPYTTGQYAASTAYVNPVHPENHDLSNSLGADIKVGLTNNLTLDVTVNPDFGQVEADPAEFNLTAFESYFSERRPFFLEGGNIFRFSLGLGDNDQSNNTLFYSRRIGRQPHHYPAHEEGYIEAPAATPIKAAAKLSGKTSSGWSLGVLDAVTVRETATVRFEDAPSLKETTEPATNYFVSRLQKDLNQGRTTIGGILTATNRQLDDDHLKWLHSDAYTGGVDFTHRFADDKYELLGALAVSNVHGTREAIYDTQTNPVHAFQRPDASHLNVDSTATTLTGFAHKLALWHTSGEHWNWGIGEWSYSPGYESNDLGFNREVDNLVQFTWLGYRENDPGKRIRRWGLNVNQWTAWSYGWERLAAGGNINGDLALLNYWSFGGGLNYEGPVEALSTLRGGPALRTDPSFNLWLFAESDERKTFSSGVNGYRGRSTNGTGWAGISPNLTWRPTDFFSLRYYMGYNSVFDTWAWYTDAEDYQSGSTEYIMADLNSTTLSATLRFDLTVTPNLSIQYYGSPFVAAGTYTDHKLVVAPQAVKHEDRYRIFTEEEIIRTDDGYEVDTDADGIPNFEFANNDFNYKQFNSNLVLRWEYQTGSTIYLVWSQGMSHFVEDGAFEFGSDLRQLFAADAENILLIKASYLLNI